MRDKVMMLSCIACFPEHVDHNYCLAVPGTGEDGEDFVDRIYSRLERLMEEYHNSRLFSSPPSSIYCLVEVCAFDDDDDLVTHNQRCEVVKQCTQWQQMEYKGKRATLLTVSLDAISRLKRFGKDGGK